MSEKKSSSYRVKFEDSGREYIRRFYIRRNAIKFAEAINAGDDRLGGGTMGTARAEYLAGPNNWLKITGLIYDKIEVPE